MSSAQHGDNNLTVAFESAWSYGLNVSTSPKSQKFPEGNGVVRHPVNAHLLVFKRLVR